LLVFADIGTISVILEADKIFEQLGNDSCPLLTFSVQLENGTFLYSDFPAEKIDQNLTAELKKHKKMFFLLKDKHASFILLFTAENRAKGE